MAHPIRLDDAAGKTLLGAYTDWGRASVLLVFPDKEYVLLCISPGYDPGDESIVEGNLCPLEFGTEQLVRSGLYTDDELLALRSDKIAKEQAALDERERQQYERLRAKFGGDA